MKIAAEVLTLVVMLASVAIVAVAFVWAAKKDGDDDQRVQRRLGIRRKTRLNIEPMPFRTRSLSYTRPTTTPDRKTKPSAAVKNPTSP